MINHSELKATNRFAYITQRNIWGNGRITYLTIKRRIYKANNGAEFVIIEGLKHLLDDYFRSKNHSVEVSSI